VERKHVTTLTGSCGCLLCRLAQTVASCQWRYSDARHVDISNPLRPTTPHIVFTDHILQPDCTSYQQTKYIN
jgi:hypothetical protein